MPNSEPLDKKSFQKKLGKRIRQCRETKGVSQAELAKRCGKDRQHIFKVEKGEINPTTYLLYLIADSLRIEIDFFQNFTEEDSKDEKSD